MEKGHDRRYKALQLGQLRAFCAFLRHKSFSEAARALGMSHSAVWQQVRALERQFGVSLLQRHGRAWQPSEDGQLLLELASSILGSVDSLKEMFEQLRKEMPRTLHVIGTPGVLMGELARPLVQFYEQYPNIYATLITNSIIDQTWELLMAGEADMAITPFDLTGPASRRRLGVVEPLCIRPAVVAMPENHPLARKRRLTLADLVRYPMILSEPDNEWCRQVKEVFRTAGLLEPLRVLLEVSLTQAARRYVGLGLGIALFALPQDDVTFANVHIRSVADLFPSQEIVILWRRGAVPRPQARLFADFLHERLAPGSPADEAASTVRRRR
ncbi:MAG TPA: LysR family transcriptional regulator [Gemmataceae bacterium]|jgi:DNA-binding transcriptional LysR family regulator